MEERLNLSESYEMIPIDNNVIFIWQNLDVILVSYHTNIVCSCILNSINKLRKRDILKMGRQTLL